MKHQTLTEFYRHYNELKAGIKTPNGHVIKHVYPNVSSVNFDEETALPMIIFEKGSNIQNIVLYNWKTKGFPTDEEVDSLAKGWEPLNVRDCTPRQC